MKFSSSCEDWSEKLAFRMEDLSPEELAGLQVHITTCLACREQFEEYQDMEQDLREYAQTLQAPDILDILLATRYEQIQYEQRRRTGVSRLLRPLYQRWQPHRSATRDRPSSLWEQKKVIWATMGIACLLLTISIPFVTTYYTRKFDNAWAHPMANKQFSLKLPLIHHGWAHAIAWSPDNNYIASLWDDDKLLVLDAHNGNTVMEEPSGWGSALAWSPDGTKIAAIGSNDLVQIWDFSHRLNTALLSYKQHSLPVNAVSWSPDGTKIASASDDGTVHIWNAQTGADIAVYQEHASRVRSVAWSHDGKYLASGDELGKVFVWDATTIKTLVVYTGHRGAITTVLWSPASAGRAADTSIASASYDGTVQIWNSLTGQLMQPIYTSHKTAQDPNGPIFSISWSPDGTKMASANYDGTVRVWMIQNDKDLSIYPDIADIARNRSNWVFAIDWSHNDNRIVSAGAENIFIFQP
ncbi:WD40 repeat domain-containing protein [Tengunoibacter tsumagoiensis]|uniref:WDR19 first beta-propeller domain-containing protein n=1 Tax=Tengunoibacter tsumagoiensis TaxID=2014871 RepID=A0A401ZXE7_9CHLR|nr:WD40 repeat domain-containing protein [Tengunoibacter tsumagoiensis]GCE11526.1 hypothetical protein KTT_13850 [Tengunoibacter tsumagoiensis]